MFHHVPLTEPVWWLFSNNTSRTIARIFCSITRTHDGTSGGTCVDKPLHLPLLPLSLQYLQSVGISLPLKMAASDEVCVAFFDADLRVVLSLKLQQDCRISQPFPIVSMSPKRGFILIAAVCAPGHSGTYPTCTPCVAPQYKPDAANGVCVDCPDGQETNGQNGATECRE